MSAIKNFLAFLYDFVVGDDWRMSLAVIVGLAFTAMAVRSGFNPWWLLPLFVVAGLGVSLRRVVRRNRES
jgi:hypothetical protein